MKQTNPFLIHLKLCWWVAIVATALLAGAKSFAADTTNADNSVAPYANETPAQRDARMPWWRDTRFDSVAPYANETPAQRDARMAWWRKARFGMFIHWGVYSVPAGVWNGKPISIKGGGEWIMHDAKIPMADYEKLPAQFNPTNFNADEWVNTAKDAGMKYIIITAKHHDGFAMFHSKASAFNIYDATPWHRDPLAELAVACKKQGIRLGFYYSQAQDWNHPGGAAAGGHWDKAQDGSMDEFIEKVDVPQIRELLSNYGTVSVLWFDSAVDMNKQRAEMILPLLKLQPGIIYNRRLGGGRNGDYETPEQRIPTNGLAGHDWETCMTINNTWGYKSYDHDFKSTETLLRNLIDIASKGGNYLLNVGPDSTGVIPAPEVQRLKEVGDWLRVNGESIYDTTGSPLKTAPAWGRVTQKGDTLYLHVFDWPADGKLAFSGLKNKIESAVMLVNGKALAVAPNTTGVTISVPANAPDKISPTIVLKITGPIELTN